MKDNPTLMVLGASEDQRFAIETAKKMGCYIIAVDIDPNATAFDIADEKIIISTRDTNKLVNYIKTYQRKKNIHGVMTMGSDIPLSVAVISEELQNNVLSRETASLASNKLQMKKRWQQDNIPIPWFKEIASIAELKNIINDRGYDLVIKPTDRSGARGITILKEGMDIDQVFRNARKASLGKEVMVEEFLPGLQLSTESIVYDEFFYTAGISDRNYDMLDRFNGSPIENGGTMPSILSKATIKQVNKLLSEAAKSLGISRGVAKGDVAFDKEGKPRMIEMAARLSGGWMSSGLITITSGVNIVETVIDISLGNEPNLKKLNPRFNKHAALRYFFPSPGKLKSISNIKEVQNKEWVKVLEFYKKEGDKIVLPTSHGERFGAFLVEGDSREEVLLRADWVYDTIRIDTE